MKKLLASFTIAILISSLPIGVASAASQVEYPQGCKTVSYTAIGGYYSQGNFYQLPGDKLTVKTHWCYANNEITSRKVSYTTTIPASSDPRFTKTTHMDSAKQNLNVTVMGTFNSGVLNNTGFIGATGTVTSMGKHSFSTISGDGG